MTVSRLNSKVCDETVSNFCIPRNQVKIFFVRYWPHIMGQIVYVAVGGLVSEVHLFQLFPTSSRPFCSHLRTLHHHSDKLLKHIFCSI